MQDVGAIGEREFEARAHSQCELGFHFTPTTPDTTLVPATPPTGRLSRSSPVIGAPMMLPALLIQ